MRGGASAPLFYMGLLVDNKCFSASSDAVDAFFSGIPATVISNGDTIYYQKDAFGVWGRVDVAPGGASSVSAVSVPSLPACNPMAGFNDGISVAVMLTVAVVVSSLFGVIGSAR